MKQTKILGSQTLEGGMKNILALFTASFVLLISSFTFNSCKDCSKKETEPINRGGSANKPSDTKTANGMPDGSSKISTSNGTPDGNSKAPDSLTPSGNNTKVSDGKKGRDGGTIDSAPSSDDKKGRDGKTTDPTPREAEEQARRERKRAEQEQARREQEEAQRREQEAEEEREQERLRQQREEAQRREQEQERERKAEGEREQERLRQQREEVQRREQERREQEQERERKAEEEREQERLRQQRRREQERREQEQERERKAEEEREQERLRQQREEVQRWEQERREQEAAAATVAEQARRELTKEKLEQAERELVMELKEKDRKIEAINNELEAAREFWDGSGYTAFAALDIMKMKAEDGWNVAMAAEALVNASPFSLSHIFCNAATTCDELAGVYAEAKANGIKVPNDVAREMLLVWTHTPCIGILSTISATVRTTVWATVAEEEPVARENVKDMKTVKISDHLDGVSREWAALLGLENERIFGKTLSIQEQISRGNEEINAMERMLVLK
jgi:chemotaxis protein histidine kinase CheA